ncbi:MAG: prepilin-type N-terminal cleavage/methylation domain-containing protein [Bacilli bacterium]|nr:prepilin-type N-terminal cleavage/methylation domain-containing protein [Bacilli bacterium]
MNKKGFTLIELLVVIVILSIIGIIAVSTIDKNIKDGRVKTCKAQEKNIIEGAKMYSVDNPNYVGEVNISSLEGLGYIKDELVNPMTDEKYDDSTSVNISYDESTKKYTYTINYSEKDKGCG